MIPTFRIELIGRKVLCAEHDAEGIGLLFEGDWKIAVWANAQIECANEDPCDVAQLVGSKLLSFTGDSMLEVLSFDNGCVLKVLLGTAPPPAESMVVYGPERTTIVWA